MTILQRAAGRRSPVLRRPRRGAVPAAAFSCWRSTACPSSRVSLRVRGSPILRAPRVRTVSLVWRKEKRRKNVLAAAKRPFRDFADLPSAVSATLVRLVEEAGDLQPESEVHLMSAFWNSIWAICNLHRCFGEIVESVGIEQDEFVALVLKPLEGSEARGKLLVGPRGTYAYVVGRGDDERYGYGGEETQLFRCSRIRQHATRLRSSVGRQSLMGGVGKSSRPHIGTERSGRSEASRLSSFSYVEEHLS